MAKNMSTKEDDGGDGDGDGDVSQQENDKIQKKEDEQDDVDKNKKLKSSKRIQIIIRILLFLPYVLAPIWTCLHPIVSVLTGELKCRGWFLDEHSIETRFMEGQSPNEIPSHLKNLGEAVLPNGNDTGSANSDPLSLCDFFAGGGDLDYNPNNLICHSHGDHFDIVMIKPLSNALDATEEAVVLVVPSPEEMYLLPVSSDDEEDNDDGTTINEKKDWGTSRLHQALIQSIKHLADPIGTPWLAKCVLIVTPTINKTSNNSDTANMRSLDETVSSFLDAYLGQQEIPRDYQINRQQHPKQQMVPQLPPRLSGAILRNLLVLQVFDNESSTTENTKKTNYNRSTDLAILPQGQRGVLPNADLVFLVGRLMERTNFMKTAHDKTFLTHPYTQQSKDATIWINQKVDGLGLDKKMATKVKLWANGIVDTLLFARTLAVGPVPPHAAALDRGIDSLTIRVTFTGTSTFRRDPVVEFVQYTEYLVRSLSNLHERLHHSFTLYLLPTPKKFVSHIEYLLPNILLLLPLAVRAFGLLFPAMKGGLDLMAMGGVGLAMILVAIAMVLPTIISPILSSLSSGTDNNSLQTTNAMLLVLYVVVAIFWIRQILWRRCDQQSISGDESDNKEEGAEEDDTDDDIAAKSIQTLQFLSCVLAAYIFVPVAFAHASLAYLPSLLWTPLLAFWDYSSMKKSTGNTFVNYAAIPILCLLVLVTAPPFFLVPHIFSSYTAFVQFAYAPLHMLFFLLVTSIIVS
ncbi:MAG: glycosylphosphatidylinositol transamidase [Bacillariaceae sp.]|jgi:glycosylphosphatidylinositol transamidase